MMKVSEAIFVARQPIFDRKSRVFGYELLFRTRDTLHASEIIDQERASLEVLTNSFLIIGLERLTHGRKAFINFSEDLILKEIPLLVSPRILVIELLESVKPSDELIEKCFLFKKMGYLIALDDFVINSEAENFLSFADIVKIDFLAYEPEILKEIPQMYSGFKIKFLAEKVENREDYYLALESDYDFFQGYFFCKPSIFYDKPVYSLKQNILHVFHIVSNDNFDYKDVENAIKRDPELTFKLLKYINSAYFCLPTKISSIRQAIVLLGRYGIKKWISLVLVSSLIKDKPSELLLLSLFRARFLELLALNSKYASKSHTFFLAGLVSLFHILSGKPMKDIVNSLPLIDDLKDALLGKRNYLFNALALCISYERGKWQKVIRYSKYFKIDLQKLGDIYLESLSWAENTLKAI